MICDVNTEATTYGYDDSSFVTAEDGSRSLKKDNPIAPYMNNLMGENGVSLLAGTIIGTLKTGSLLKGSLIGLGTLGIDSVVTNATGKSLFELAGDAGGKLFDLGKSAMSGDDEVSRSINDSMSKTQSENDEVSGRVNDEVVRDTTPSTPDMGYEYQC